MTTIKLSGSLARKFGRIHRRQLESGDTWEAFKALKATLVGFEEEIRRLDGMGLRFAVFRNRHNVGVDDFGRGGVRELRIVPVIGGSKRGGLLQTIIGVAIVALAWWNPLGWTAGTALAVGMAGGSMALGGVIQMLSPQPNGLSMSAGPENKPSYAFGSANNTTASGNPVPICIGDRRWGGAIISASIYAQDKT